MRWRLAYRLMLTGLLAALLPGCFEVPALPDAPACDFDDDCSDDVFCNGLELCEDGQCVSGPPCDGLCTDDGDGDGECEGDFPEAEPEPGTMPEPDGPEAEPEPGTMPEPDSNPSEPEPGSNCNVEGRSCLVDEGTQGVCLDGTCTVVRCQNAANCPLPGCATCESGICGVRSACASISLSCAGPPTTRIQIECGGNTTFQACGLGDNQLHVGCDSGNPATACCGAFDGACIAAVPIPATVTMMFDPILRWDCSINGEGRALCSQPQLTRRTETAAHCDIDLLNIPGQK